MPDDLLAAARALACLVRDEYPAGYSLAEIAATWGNNLTPDALAALERVQGAL